LFSQPSEYFYVRILFLNFENSIQMKHSIVLSIFTFILLFSSCGSSLVVKTDYDKETNFTSFKTFSFADMNMDRTNISELNENRLIKAVKNEMTKKGFTQVENADLEIHMHAVVENKWSATAHTDYYGSTYPYYRRGLGWGTTYGTTSVDVNEYQEGTLIIDLVDTEAKKLVWQGVGTAILKNKPKDVDERINKAVTKILAGFPPGK
jgi:uncharacterized protein DUF4136